MGKQRSKPRIKRHHLKRWSSAMINMGQSLHKGGMEALYQRNLSVDLKDEELLFKLFYPPMPDDIKEAVERRALSSPRAEALRKAFTDQLKVLREEQGLVSFKHTIVLRHTRYEKTCMLRFPRGAAMLTQVVLPANIFKRSLLYPSTERAIEVFQKSRVTWVEIKQIQPAPANA